MEKAFELLAAFHEFGGAFADDFLDAGGPGEKTVGGERGKQGQTEPRGQGERGGESGLIGAPAWILGDDNSPLATADLKISHQGAARGILKHDGK